jgi:hypothetical protein
MSNYPANVGAYTRVTINGVQSVDITLNASVTRIELENNVLKLFLEPLREGVANPQVVPEESSSPAWDDDSPDPDDEYPGLDGIPADGEGDNEKSEPTDGADQCPTGTWWCMGCYEYVSLETHVFQGNHRRGVWCSDCRNWH